MNLSSISAAVMSLAALAAAPAMAADCNPSVEDGGPTGIPSFSDLSVPGGVIACAGFVEGNLNSGNPFDLATVQALLASPAWVGYGLSTTGRIEQIDTSTSPIDFATPLSGLTLVGFHWGNYGGNSNPAGNVSALYLFDAGTSLDTFGITQTQGLSNAAIWVVGEAPVPGIPEPETYALMLAGLGAVTWVARRRRRA